MKRILLALMALNLLGQANSALAVEEPSYELIEKSGDIEIREYRPLIVAETVVDGELDSAGNRGFRLIAAYIFGDNQSADGKQEKIAMTAPVTVEPEASGKIAAADTGNHPVSLDAQRWRVEFVMPSQYTLASLPHPRNPAVTLKEIPVRRYAVIRFSGFTGQQKVQQKLSELSDWLHHRGLDTTGAPRLARYNPPWTLPFLKRNEIMLEIQPIN